MMKAAWPVKPSKGGKGGAASAPVNFSKEKKVYPRGRSDSMKKVWPVGLSVSTKQAWPPGLFQCRRRGLSVITLFGYNSAFSKYSNSEQLTVLHCIKTGDTIQMVIDLTTSSLSSAACIWLGQ